MGWCLKMCEGTFCLKIADSNSIHCFKVRRISNSTNGSSLKQCIFQKKYSIGALDAPAQGASFYVEKIKLASKLRELYQKWCWSRLFSNKKSPHTFSDTNPSNFIICKFKHFKRLFSLHNSKTTYYEPFWLISNVFNFSVRLVSNSLKGFSLLYNGNCIY